MRYPAIAKCILSTPTTQIANTKQKLAYSYGQKIHALVPNARFETFEKCGHVPQFEEPEKFNQLTLQFIKELK